MQLQSSTIGARHELLVCADLMHRGFAVFRGVSPDCPCDLVVLQNGRVRRVEVTTGSRLATGEIHHPKRAAGRWDVLAVVVSGESTVTYMPPWK